MFLISTQPTDTFTRLQIRFATLIFHSQKPVSIIQHFTIGYSEACETFRWVRPALRSDTLKIKAIDLCSGRDSLPAWHAVLAALWLVCQWGSVCVCAHAWTSLYKIICARLCVSIYVARVKLGSLCKPVRRVHGSLEMEVDLEDFHLACFGKGGGTAGQLEWTTGYVCETVALPLMKRERRCRQTGNRSHSEKAEHQQPQPFFNPLCELLWPPLCNSKST